MNRVLHLHAGVMIDYVDVHLRHLNLRRGHLLAHLPSLFSHFPDHVLQLLHNLAARSPLFSTGLTTCILLRRNATGTPLLCQAYAFFTRQLRPFPREGRPASALRFVYLFYTWRWQVF